MSERSFKPIRSLTGRVRRRPPSAPSASLAVERIGDRVSIIDSAVYVDGDRVASPTTLGDTYRSLREHEGAVAWIGLLFCAAALVVFAATLKVFGDSFRVGIDEQQPDKLVTAGSFAFSRNPIYVCFLAFFFGMFLQYPNLILAGLIVLFAPLIHRQILREETFLRAQYGEQYAAYCARVRRYL